MYTMPDGSYLVFVELFTGDLPAKIEERHGFTADMKPKFFEFTAKSLDPANSVDTRVSCNYGKGEITCEMEFDGRTSSASMKQEQPYFFFLSDSPIFDLVWASQMMVVQAARTPSQATPIPLLGVHDLDDLSGIKLAVDETERVQYLGRETIDIADHKVQAHKFQYRTQGQEAADSEYWLSDSGLLLKMTTEDIAFVLTSYKGPKLQ